MKKSLNLILLIIAICTSNAQDLQVMNDEAIQLEKAIYLFEMEGNFFETTKIFQRLTKSKDPEIQLRANILLGKIYKISNNRSQATKYFQQALKSTLITTNDRNWIIQQLKDFTLNPIHFVESIEEIKSPIVETFSDKLPHYFLSRKGLLYKIYDDNFIDTKYRFKAGHSKILLIKDNIIATFYPSKNEIHLTSINSYSSHKVIYKLSSDFRWIHQTLSRQFLILTKNRLSLFQRQHSKWQIEQNFENCNVAGELKTLRQIALNCNNEKLYFISLRDGSTVQSMDLPDNTQNIHQIKDFFYIQTDQSILKYDYRNLLSPIWNLSFVKITESKMVNGELFLTTLNPVLYKINLDNGSITWSKKIKHGLIINLVDKLGILSNDGLLSAYDFNSNFLWDYHCGQKPSTLPVANNKFIYLPLKTGKVIILSNLYFGLQPTILSELNKSLDSLTPSNNWDSINVITQQIENLEPGNSKVWLTKAAYYEKVLKNRDSTLLAWDRAVSYSKFKNNLEYSILEKYQNKLRANWIQSVDKNPDILFPHIYSHKEVIYFIHNNNLSAYDKTNGSVLWESNFNKNYDFSKAYLSFPHLFLPTQNKVDVMNLNKEAKISTSLSLSDMMTHIIKRGSNFLISSMDGSVLAVDTASFSQSWAHSYFIESMFLANNTDPNTFFSINIHGRIKLINSLNGNIIHERVIKTAGVVSVFEDETDIYFFTRNNYLYSINKGSLKKNWHHNLKYAITSLITNKNSIFVGLTNQDIVSIDKSSGLARWYFQGQSSFLNRPTLHKNVLLIEQDSKIIMLNATTGKKTKSYSFPTRISFPTIYDEDVYLTSESGLLYSMPMFEILR